MLHPAAPIDRTRRSGRGIFGSNAAVAGSLILVVLLVFWLFSVSLSGSDTAERGSESEAETQSLSLDEKTEPDGHRVSVPVAADTLADI